MTMAVFDSGLPAKDSAHNNHDSLEYLCSVLGYSIRSFEDCSELPSPSPLDEVFGHRAQRHHTDPKRESVTTSATTSVTPSMSASCSSTTTSTAQMLPEPPISSSERPLEWDWSIEHADRQRERQADAALHGQQPFEVDRGLLKDVVREKFSVAPARIRFLSAGTFHKAYLITLVSGREIVARVARRYMPRLKTESEVATLRYLRENTNIPVPTIYHYDSSPYNRLGGEYILMSKAPGRPLRDVYQDLNYDDLVKVLTNVAKLVVPLFGHRFSKLGSLYFDDDDRGPTSPSFSNLPTPNALHGVHMSSFPFTPPSLGMSHLSISSPDASNVSTPRPKHNFKVGPIISWPFFGSNRGELTHPDEVNRGPWSTTQDYFNACLDREVKSVIRENEGKSAPHRLHLDPDEIISSRHHHLRAVPGDQSDDSDEYDLEESDAEWDGPGDGMYRDYRRMQRSTFLVAHLEQRVQCVQSEMDRWLKLMNRLMEKYQVQPTGAEEIFGLDCHDLSLENVFVDLEDPTKITCIIDWESTTTRPLWQCAHLPAFLGSSPFTAKLFREIVEGLAEGSSPKFAILAREWLRYEENGVRLRTAHRFVEWDGWEEGLAESMLGPADSEDDWFDDEPLDAGQANDSDGSAEFHIDWPADEETYAESEDEQISTKRDAD